jgi:ribosomal protein L37AE/L43A
VGKYDSLREPPNNDIVGRRYVKALSTFVYSEDFVIIIRGLVPCPECGHTLDKNFNADAWVCSECETTWSNQELLKAIVDGCLYT